MNITTVLNNIRTTLAGMATILAVLAYVANCFKTGTPVDLNQVLLLVGGVSIGAGLIAAKDGNVTGGSKEQ